MDLDSYANWLGHWFERTGQIALLEEAIQLEREAVDRTARDDPSRAMYLHNLGCFLEERFVEIDAIPDLEEAIRLGQEAVDCTAYDHPSRAMYLNRLSVQFGARFKRMGAASDLEKAIQLGQEAVDCTPHDHPRRAVYLNSLSVMLGNQFKRTGATSDLEKAIQLGQEVVDCTAHNHPSRAMYLNNLSVQLEDQFKRTGATSDLEKAIQLGQEAVDCTPHDHPRRAVYLNSLSVQLEEQFKRTGATSDLEKAIQLGQEAVDCTSHDHSSQAMYLNSLSVMLEGRFERTDAMSDLEEAIQLEQEAVDCTALNNSNRAGYLSNLSKQLGNRFKRTGTRSDLEKAIQLGQEAVDCTACDDPNRAIYLNNLGNRFRHRFETTGAMADLEAAIQLGQKAVDCTVCDHPNQAMYLNNLGNQLSNRFERTGAMADLEAAIQLGQKAVDCTACDDPNRARFLSNLGKRFKARFERTGAKSDLEKAIQLGQEAVDCTACDDPDQAMYLHNLGSFLEKQFEKTVAMSDLEQAIQLEQKAVDCTPHDHPNQAVYLSSLGAWLGSRSEIPALMAELEEFMQFEEAVYYTARDDPNRTLILDILHELLGNRYHRTHALSDLRKASRLASKALDCTACDYPDQATYLDNLERCQREKFEKTDQMSDLEEATWFGQQVLDCTARNHPNRGKRLDDLGMQLEKRLERTGGKIRDSRGSLNLFTEALNIYNARPLDRINAGKYAFIYYIRDSNWKSARTASDAVVGLLPRLNLRWLSRHDQQHLIKSLTHFSSLAASAVLQAEGTPAEAVEILEAGRGVIASFIINAQSDISRLEEYKPELYYEYMTLRQHVNVPFSNIAEPEISPSSGLTSTIQLSTHELQSNVHRSITQRHRDIERLEEIESKIRQLPGLDRFLLPPTSTDLMTLAVFGPIVSFNVTMYRSDVFIITTSAIVGMRLEELLFNDLRKNVGKLLGKSKLSVGRPSTKPQRQKELQNILRWLWDVAVYPVLSQLRFISPVPSNPLPHIWWVTSGYMGLMPLHAAGHTDKTALDYVVSSYIPTVKALKYSREQQLRRPLEPNPNMLIVTMPETAGMGALKTVEEVESISRSIYPIVPTILNKPSKKIVLDEVRTHHMVHFSCHGNSDSTDPSAGGLFLGPGEDGRAEHFTVRELANISYEHARIAFLSACSTAENSSKELIDEVIHMASAFQLIGFPHVIGTLWEASDKAATWISGAFYESLMRSLREDDFRVRHDVVANALHQAVRRLRERMRNDLISWVPFIHVGA
ncbi:uncharacterized protein CIMG_05722 [Coccidioides immitis RS]|uniref:CHAT domain-containing protein n=1 Tax=Coccidioides immitis (strain RS) TaxID=246410 RepID=J3K6M1_COCIM|nr:uncharacterized protein CIMG_05722 [Coccidioides immitis RS]EAS30243.3 hypothetical protein CIMG_05722 [Coccidioides immitis RS]